MKRKQKKLIAAFVTLCTALSFSAASVSADSPDREEELYPASEIKVTFLPITEEFIAKYDAIAKKRMEEEKQGLLRDPKEDASEMAKLYPASEIKVTHLPVTDAFKAEQEERARQLAESEISMLEKEKAGAVYETRGATVPDEYWNIGVKGAYDGYGNTRRVPIYSSCYFTCNSDLELVISGQVLVSKPSEKDLTIELCNKTDGTSTPVTISPTAIDQNPFETKYSFDFKIGPLNPDHFYYLKFNIVEWDSGHQVDFKVSH